MTTVPREENSKKTSVRRPRQPSPPPGSPGRSAISSRPRGGGGVVVAIIGAAGLIIAALIAAMFVPNGPLSPRCEPLGDSGPRGCIALPTTGDSVSQKFTVVGNLVDIPDATHVWLATVVDNEYWPKMPEVPTGRAFNVTIVEEGRPADGKFSLALLLVDKQADQDIRDWLDHGERTGDYPGLRIGAMEVLDVVAELRLR
jgi:hypothetical protein